jgi:hypothetical protein
MERSFIVLNFYVPLPHASPQNRMEAEVTDLLVQKKLKPMRPNISERGTA